MEPYLSRPVRLVLGDAAKFPKARDHAYTDGETITLAPRMLQASPDRVLGVLLHELGHCVLVQGGVEHRERDADHAIEVITGLRISYDADDVQTVGRGTRPRPAYLPE